MGFKAKVGAWAFLVFSIAGCATVRPSVFTKRSGTFAEPSAEDMRDFRSPASGPHVDKSGYLYDPGDTSCGGFPRLKVETAPGMCLGLVMPKERALDPVEKRAFSMPRTLVQIPGTKDFIVADMGSWHVGRGALFRLTLVNGQYRLKLLKKGLNYPHAVKLGPDGKFWIGELNAISRFSLDASGAIAGWQTMVAGLPAFPDDSHPLSQFAFDPRNNDLYINSGAPSDHCFTKTPVGECPEVKGNDLSGILRVRWTDLQTKAPVKTWTAVAKGLRNSVAMAISSSGVLIQGENSRDFSDSSEPYEEINAVDLAGPKFHYGWPYCYDFRATSPEWVNNTVVKCDAGAVASREGDYQEPFALIPPHAAPLDAGYYQGAMFPELKGTLLMAWHGYRKPGHRLVAYDVDASGRPVIDQKASNATFNFDRKEDGCVIAKKMDPRGGLVRHAPYRELVARWNERKDLRPRGAPASFTVADDGSIWIAEDKNQTIVRLARDATSFVKEACDPNADDRMELLAWRRAVLESPQLVADYNELHQKLIKTYCASCHDDGIDRSLTSDSMSGLDFLVNSAWFVPGKPEKSKGLQAILHEGTAPPMPLPGSPQFYGTSEGEDLVRLVQRWIGEIPANVDTRYAKTSLKSARKIRSAPGGTLCGSLAVGATAYIDPRPETFVKKDSWTWARLYLPPDHAALSGSTCAWPQDGVFYLATTQTR